MKKSYIFLTLVLLVSFAQAKMQYAQTTLKTYSAVNDVKPSGKVLPTTGFEVLKLDGDKAQVKLIGWNKGKMERMLYFSKGERIISGAFSKKAKFDSNVIKTEEIGKNTWSKVTLITWIENKNLTSDIDALFDKANNLLEANCGLCHGVHPTKEFSANQWPSVIKAMIPRTSLSKEEGWLVTQYVQKHAKK